MAIVTDLRLVCSLHLVSDRLWMAQTSEDALDWQMLDDD